MLTKVSGPLVPPAAAAVAANFSPSVLLQGGAGAAEAVGGGAGGPGAGGSHFAVGDLVQICADIERMKVGGFTRAK